MAKTMSHQDLRKSRLSVGRRRLPGLGKKVAVEHEGFGIVESIAAGAVLAGVIVSAAAISVSVENAKYQASIRDAIRQVIDDDVEYLNHRIFAYDYIAAGSSNGVTTSNACYKTHSSCAPSQILSSHVQYCRNLASNIINSLGGRSSILNLNSQSHAVLVQAPLVIRRTLSAEKPSMTQGYVQNVDSSIIRTTYSVDRVIVDRATPGLLASANGEVLRVVDLYPAAHAYCNPE